MNHRCIILFMFGCLMTSWLSIPGVQAEDSQDTMMVFDLGRIEVVGDAEKSEVVSNTVLNTDDFDEALVESVVDAARREPGVSVTVGSKNEPQIFLRGFSQQRVQILYDGVPMAAPYYAEIDTSELPLDNLAEMKIVRGNASVMYGPNAMGGVVSLVSAKPGIKPNLSILGTVDQEGNLVGRFSHGMRVNQFYYQISAGIRDSDGWRMSDDFETVYDEDDNVLEDGDVRDNAAFEQWSAGFKAGGEWDRSEITLSFNYQDAEKNIPASTDPDGSIRYWNFPEWKKYSIMLSGKVNLTQNLDLRANLFYHKYDNTLINYKDPDYTSVKWQSTYDDYSTGAMIRSAWTPVSDVTVRFSLNGIMDNHKEQGDEGDPWGEYRANTYSYLAEAEWLTTESFTLQVGAGWNIYNFDSVDNVEGQVDSIRNRTDDVEALEFSFLGRYVTGENHEFTAAFSQKNRFPNMHELFSNIEEFEPEDVSTIDAESSLQYSLGYMFNKSMVHFGASGFYYDVKDMIERLDRDALYTNLDDVKISGLELWGSYGGDTGIQAGFAYTYLNTDVDSPVLGGDELPYVPDHYLHADLGYDLQCGTDIVLGITYRDTVIEYDDTVLEVPSYTLLDLSVSHAFEFGLTVTLQGLNLTDKDYVTEIGFPLPGRTIKLGLKYTI
jgi:iron complex outermembrane recepter protein